MTLPYERYNAIKYTEDFLSYNTLIEQFETHYGKKIRWTDETKS